MEKFFGTIIVIVIIFWILALLGRLLLPFIMRRKMKKMQDRMQDMFNQQFSQQSSDFTTHKEGDVEIQYTKHKNNNETSLSDELGGEYVDYEEIK